MVQDDKMLRRDIVRILWVLWPFPALGVIAILMFARTAKDGWSVLATALIAAAATALAGAFFGLLFGIPRSLAQGHAATATEPASAKTNGAPPGSRPALGEGYGGNSNLLLRRGEEEGHQPSEQDIEDVTAAVDKITTSHETLGFAVREVEDASPELLESAKNLARFPLSEMRGSTTAAWARAQLLLRHYALAVRGFDVALTIAPDDPECVQELMFAALYLDPPESFRRAISTGERFKQRTAAMNVYLAAAYGQKYR